MSSTAQRTTSAEKDPGTAGEKVNSSGVDEVGRTNVDLESWGLHREYTYIYIYICVCVCVCVCEDFE